MRTPSSTRRFRKDVERVGRRGKDLPKLREAIDLLCAGQPLPAKYRDHALLGDLKGFRGSDRSFHTIMRSGEPMQGTGQ